MFYALSENISFHGILLRMEKMVAAGTSVSLSVEIPSRFRKRYLSASGTVVRIIKLGDQSYELAVSCRQRPFVIRFKSTQRLVNVSTPLDAQSEPSAGKAGLPHATSNQGDS